MFTRVARACREFKKSDEVNQAQPTAAVMEGKLKEKLESMGIAFLCVAQSAPVIMNSICELAATDIHTPDFVNLA